MRIALVLGIALSASRAAEAQGLAGDPAETLRRAGEYVEQYYSRAQRIVGVETITVESGVPATSERRLCATDGVQIIGQITYRGTPAVAARLLASGTAVALALDTCRPLAEAPAP